MAFKAALLKNRAGGEKDGVKEKTKKEIYDDIAADLNNYHHNLFGGILKGTAVQEKWINAISAAKAQQEDKEKRKHLWYNSNTLCAMSEYELLLDNFFVEKGRIDTIDEQKKKEDEEEELDVRERMRGALSRVAERYETGEAEIDGGKKSAKKRKGEGDDTESDVGKDSPSSDPGRGSKRAFGRGEKKGNHGNVASGNPGLSLDKPKTEVQEIVDMQAEVLQIAKDIAQGPQKASSASSAPDPIEVSKAEVVKMSATAALIAALTQAGMPIPQNILKKLEEM